MPQITKPRTRLKAAIIAIHALFPQNTRISYVSYVYHKQDWTDISLGLMSFYPLSFQYRLEFQNDILFLVKGESSWNAEDEESLREFQTRVLAQLNMPQGEFTQKVLQGEFGQAALSSYNAYQRYQANQAAGIGNNRIDPELVPVGV